MSAPELIGPEAVAALTIEQKRKQVADQYRVVAHLAAALMTVHSQLARSIEAGCAWLDPVFADAQRLFPVYPI